MTGDLPIFLPIASCAPINVSFSTTILNGSFFFPANRIYGQVPSPPIVDPGQVIMVTSTSVVWDLLILFLLLVLKFGSLRDSESVTNSISTGSS